jgi:hypothetical protein
VKRPFADRSSDVELSARVDGKLDLRAARVASRADGPIVEQPAIGGHGSERPVARDRQAFDRRTCGRPQIVPVEAPRAAALGCIRHRLENQRAKIQKKSDWSYE